MPTKLPQEPKRKKVDYNIKDSGERRNFGTGAVRDMSSGKGRFDLVPMEVIRALAIHYEKGCLKYGDRNWEKGIPIHSFLDSSMRHLAQVIDGCNDENHLIAAIWNAVCAYQTILRIQRGEYPKELYDLPRKVTLPMPYGDEVKVDWSKIPTLKELERYIQKVERGMSSKKKKCVNCGHEKQLVTKDDLCQECLDRYNQGIG